jgi:hypothetical protein
MRRESDKKRVRWDGTGWDGMLWDGKGLRAPSSSRRVDPLQARPLDLWICEVGGRFERMQMRWLGNPDPSAYFWDEEMCMRW